MRHHVNIVGIAVLTVSFALFLSFPLMHAAVQDDYSDDVDTTGSLTPDESTTGNIETANDEDWFAASLEAKRIYQIDVEGPSTNGGTLDYPLLWGLHDADGNEIAGTSATGGGEGENVRLTYQAREEETHFLAVGAEGDGTGTYTVGIIDVTDEDAGAEPAEAFDLGDITSLVKPQFPEHAINGMDDAVDTYRFTLLEAKKVGLGLRQQEADADLVLEDAYGNVLGESRASGPSKEWVSLTLLAGTYYISVEAQAEGANLYVLRYGVGQPDAARVAALLLALENTPVRQDNPERENIQDTVTLSPPTATFVPVPEPVSEPQQLGGNAGTETVENTESEGDLYGTTRWTAGRLSNNLRVTGEVRDATPYLAARINSGGDNDWFRVTGGVDAWNRYKIQIRSSELDLNKVKVRTFLLANPWSHARDDFFDADPDTPNHYHPETGPGTYVPPPPSLPGTVDTATNTVSFLTRSPATSFYLEVWSRDRTATGAYEIRVIHHPVRNWTGTERGHDDLPSDSSTWASVTVGGPAVSGRYHYHGDHDWFRVNLTRHEGECGVNGQKREIKKYRIDVVARGTRQIQAYPDHKGVYPVIRMYRPDGSAIGEDGEDFYPGHGEGDNARLSAFGLGLSTNPDRSPEGEYYIEVSSGFEKISEINNYVDNCQKNLCPELIDSTFGYESSPFIGAYYDLTVTLVDNACPGS